MTASAPDWRPIDPLDVNGDPPAIAGMACDELLVEGGWYAGVEESPAHVAHLRVGAEWHRLYFDTGMVFWRIDAERPQSFDMEEYGWGFRLTDLGAETGAAGERIHRYNTLISDTETMVRLSFASGLSIDFINHHASDNTRYIVHPAEEA